jgi:hypothetical protein
VVEQFENKFIVFAIFSAPVPLDTYLGSGTTNLKVFYGGNLNWPAVATQIEPFENKFLVFAIFCPSTSGWIPSINLRFMKIMAGAP